MPRNPKCSTCRNAVHAISPSSRLRYCATSQPEDACNNHEHGEPTVVRSRLMVLCGKALFQKSAVTPAAIFVLATILVAIGMMLFR